MDAKVEDWVVTPRRGKPVEINALWYNALHLLSDWRRQLQIADGELDALAQLTKRSFNQRFWFEGGGYLFDIVDGEAGDDASCRPNQVLSFRCGIRCWTRSDGPPCSASSRSGS